MILKLIKGEGEALDQILNIDKTRVYYKHVPEGPTPPRQREKNMPQDLRMQKITNFDNPPLTTSE